MLRYQLILSLTAIVVAALADRVAFANGPHDIKLHATQTICPRLLGASDVSPRTRVIDDLQRRYNDFRREELATFLTASSTDLAEAITEISRSYLPEYVFFEEDQLVKVADQPWITEFDEIAVIFANREEGIRQIRSTVSVTKFEHSWIYIPEKQIWFDSALRVDPFEVTDKPALNVFLLSQFSVVESYHTHPDYSVELAYGINVPPEYDFLAQGANPSPQDLAQCWANQAHGSGNRYIGHVVSHNGVTSYEVKPGVNFSTLPIRKENFKIFLTPWPADHPALRTQLLHQFF